MLAQVYFTLFVLSPLSRSGLALLSHGRMPCLRCALYGVTDLALGCWCAEQFVQATRAAVYSWVPRVDPLVLPAQVGLCLGEGDLGYEPPG